MMTFYSSYFKVYLCGWCVCLYKADVIISVNRKGFRNVYNCLNFIFNFFVSLSVHDIWLGKRLLILQVSFFSPLFVLSQYQLYVCIVVSFFLLSQCSLLFKFVLMNSELKISVLSLSTFCHWPLQIFFLALNIFFISKNQSI